MKKIVSILVVLSLMCSLNVFAATGDVVGEIYSTDILAYVNGRPINSYNIGGKTVVLAEDLCNNDTGSHYGFSCVYDNSTRTLTLESDFSDGNASASVVRGKVGEVVGNVYETDIKVVFNSHRITGYNIGGQTAVCIEDLGQLTEENADFGYSKYLCKAVWDGSSRTISLDSFRQDANFFSKYPHKKFVFELNDNILTCSFDQLNPYVSSLKINLSDDFKQNVGKVSPVVLNGENVGMMVVTSSGIPVFNMNELAIFRQTNEMQKILSYDEAKKYVADNFEVISKSEVENGYVYLAKKGDFKYILFAVKSGGLVCDSKYDSSYSKVELTANGNSTPSLTLENPTFSGTIPISTEGYDFSDNIKNYLSGSLPEKNRILTRYGDVNFTVDGVKYTLSGIYPHAYGYDVMVDFESACEIFDITWSSVGGRIFMSSPKRKHDISATFISDSAVIPQLVSILPTSKVFVNDVEKSFTYLDGEVLREARPYYYGQKIFVPARFFMELYK